VKIEKSSVCRGEENLVTVRAHSANGTDEFLRYSIAGELGNAAPLKSYGSSVPLAPVVVFDRDGEHTTVPIPVFRVLDCDVPRWVTVTAGLQPNTSAEYAFHATIGATPANPVAFEPVEYTWTFGDDSRAVTTAGEVTHDYGFRPQTTLQSDFLVSVSVKARNGTTLVGRTSLSLRNPTFEMLSKGIVAIEYSLDPRFPVADDEGKVHQTVRMWHHDQSAIRIDRVAVSRSYQDGPSGPVSVLSGRDALGVDVIPAGKEGVTSSLELDPSNDPKMSSVDYEVKGHSAAGLPATVRFSVMRPPMRRKVTDPVMLAKIATAQRILQKDSVSHAEFYELERKGLLGPDAGVASSQSAQLP
jgi:hypothetical protein